MKNKRLIKLFLIIGMIFSFYLIFPIVIGVKTIDKIENSENQEEIKKWGIIAFFFVNIVAGLLIFTSNSNEERYKNIDKKTYESPEESLIEQINLGRFNMKYKISGILLLDTGYTFVGVNDAEMMAIILSSNKYSSPKNVFVGVGDYVNSTDFSEEEEFYYEMVPQLLEDYYYSQCKEKVYLMKKIDIKQLEALANRNNLDAIFNIARYYSVGLKRNDLISFKWYKKAADDFDNVIALMFTANNFEIGEGVEKNLDEAKYYYKKVINKAYKLDDKYYRWIYDSCVAKLKIIDIKSLFYDED